MQRLHGHQNPQKIVIDRLRRMNLIEKSKNNNVPLYVASVVSILILCIVAAFKDDFSQALFISLLCVSVTLGLFSIAGFIEIKMKSALGFETFRWVFVSALALVAYMSRVDAVNDINGVFHIDAGALPLTTIAVTVLRFATYMFWPMAFVCGISLLLILALFRGFLLDGKDDIEKIGLGARVFAAFVSSGLACILICGQLSDAGIKAKLYRIAHKADFVGSFNCQGIDADRFAALFIGPEQRRVLLAERIPDDKDFLNAKDQQPELMRPVSIPTFFPIMGCSPGLPPAAP